MALYRFEAKIIGRSGGRSTLSAAAYRAGQTARTRTATSAAAYRHGSVITDERTGVIYDYTRKRGVGGSEILTPESAPAWASEREQLWNQVEHVERRKDAQLARDFVISLPYELDHQQRRAMLGEFLNRHFVDQGYVCDVAYHLPHGKGDDRNHHAHVMVPTRILDQEGFSRTKERPEGNPIGAWKKELAELREDWAATVNRHLEAAGSPERVSHLSLEDRGIDRAPEPKQGPLATQIEREGRESHAGNDRRRVKAENAERESIQTEISSVVSLAVEAIKRGKMNEPNEELLEQQAKREADLLAQMQQQEQGITDFKKAKAAEAEEAKKHEHANEEQQTRASREGDIANAGTRYSLALGKCYDMKDPYSSLADAAMAEWTAFKGEQESLRMQSAAEEDPEKRREIDLRRKIEGCEYMSITSDRLGDISATIAGREDAPQAVLDRERAVAWDDHATRLRDERAGLQADREVRERDVAGEGRQPSDSGERERTDREGEITDAQAEKFARREAAGRAQEQQEMDRGDEAEHSYG